MGMLLFTISFEKYFQSTCDVWYYSWNSYFKLENSYCIIYLHWNSSPLHLGWQTLLLFHNLLFSFCFLPSPRCNDFKPISHLRSYFLHLRQFLCGCSRIRLHHLLHPLHFLFGFAFSLDSMISVFQYSETIFAYQYVTFYWPIQSTVCIRSYSV